MNKSKKRLKIIVSILAAAFILLLLLVTISNQWIEVKSYGEGDIKILVLSDLHGREFGRNNKRLIKKISEQQPDIICLDGDFVDEDNTATENEEFFSLVKNLLGIAPVYYAIGNHDLMYFMNHGDDITFPLEEIGCIVLNKNYVDIQIGTTPLRLGGLFDYAFNQQGMSEWDWKDSDIYRFLSDFTATDSTTVLLSHRPDSFIYGDASRLWDIDFVLSGHTHGGLWRLPFIGGVIAPEQGFDPEYDKGEFEIGNIRMIISSGLSGYGSIPRLFNRPEITVVNI